MKLNGFQSTKPFERMSLYPDTFEVDYGDGEICTRYRTSVKVVFEYNNLHLGCEILSFVYYPHRAVDNLPAWERVTSIHMFKAGDDSETFNIYTYDKYRTVLGDEPLYTFDEHSYMCLMGA